MSNKSKLPASLLQLKMFNDEPGESHPAIAITPEILELLHAGSPVAIGVSGGKDSDCTAIATNDYLDEIGHTGPRVLIHADLGEIEWEDSLPACERLAQLLGLELIVVRRKAGGLLERWEARWKRNLTRYINLECVRVILPWSTPKMRFCTSELKTDVICRKLSERFPGQVIISVSGIRAEESAQRAKAPIAQVQNKLYSKLRNTSGFDWHSILGWKLTDVLSFLSTRGRVLHEAYRIWKTSRVSCAFCIMGSWADLVASARCPANAATYRRLCRLEIVSTFAFQGDRWLCDVAPELLDEDLRAQILIAKERARKRQEIEARVPKHLLYAKEWPTCIPTQEEAELLCEVRRAVAEVMGIAVKYTEPGALIARYEELMRLKIEKAKKSRKRSSKNEEKYFLYTP